MSSISGLSSAASLYPYQTTNPSSTGQLRQNLNAVGTALQSGDVSGAQSALTTLQQTLANNPQSSTSQPFGTNTAANSDYQSLVGAVQSGNVSDAQKALANLQTDLKSGHAHGGHHHHGGGAAPSTSTDTTTTNSTTDADGDNDGSSVLNVTV